MVIVHHLNFSRSHRILWALEELEVPYEIKHYQRQANKLAPEALKQVHPLGKSPVIEDNGQVIAESGAILEYLQRHYDPGNQFRPQDKSGLQAYQYWLHYAEGSLMPLNVMKLVFSQLGKPPVPIGIRAIGSLLNKGIQKAYLNPQIQTHIDFIEHELNGRDWFAGSQLSMADIQMCFPIFALLARGQLTPVPNILAWKARIEARPAWQRALDKGGPLIMPL